MIPLMPSERVQRRIDALLDDVEEAADQHDWRLVLELTAGILDADADNEDALTFQGMAEASVRASGSNPERPRTAAATTSNATVLTSETMNRKRTMPTKKKAGYSTRTGYVNRNRQTNLGMPNPPRRGTDKNQWVYVLHCLYCDNRYGANGSDIHLRLCPSCQAAKLVSPESDHP